MRRRLPDVLDAAVAALATDPKARVMVFVDGQNLYKECRDLFGHSLCHPHLLGQYLAGPRVAGRFACRFYTGRPNPNIAGENEKTRHLDRRLNGMRRMGVTVVTRPLRYHWAWGHRQDLPRPEAGAAPQTVTMKPWQRPQEKGIDLALALDVIEFVLKDYCDVAIIVSLDRDLYEIPTTLRELRKFVQRPVRLEAAVPVPETQKHPKTLPAFSYTHQITREVFDLVRDDTNYRGGPEGWTLPDFPRTLADVTGASSPTAPGTA